MSPLKLLNALELLVVEAVEVTRIYYDPVRFIFVAMTVPVLLVFLSQMVRASENEVLLLFFRPFKSLRQSCEILKSSSADFF